MNDCTKNFIGIKSSCDQEGFTPPTSGLYIEELEGISFNRLAEIEYGKYVTVKSLFEAKMETAIGLVMDDVKAKMDEKFNNSFSLEFLQSNVFSEEVSSDGNLKVTISKKTGFLSGLFVPCVYLKFAVDQTVELKINMDGVEKTQDVECVANVEKEVVFDCSVGVKKIILSIENAESPMVCNLGKTDVLKSCGGCSGAGLYSYITMKGESSTDSRTKKAFGIRADVMVNCQVENSKCLILKRLKYPILYKLGILLLQEWLASDRLNLMAIQGKKFAQKKIGEWEEVDYENRLATATEGLPGFLQSIDSDCFTCKGRKYGYVRP